MQSTRSEDATAKSEERASRLAGLREPRKGKRQLGCMAFEKARASPAMKIFIRTSASRARILPACFSPILRAPGPKQMILPTGQPACKKLWKVNWQLEYIALETARRWNRQLAVKTARTEKMIHFSSYNLLLNNSLIILTPIDSWGFGVLGYCCIIENFCVH